MSICKNCIYAINPYKDPFTGKMECCCSIAEEIVNEFGDRTIITSNLVTSCDGFEPRAAKYIDEGEDDD